VFSSQPKLEGVLLEDLAAFTYMPHDQGELLFEGTFDISRPIAVD